MTVAVERGGDFAGIGAAAWNGLAGRSATRTVFQTWQWHAAWWEVFGGGCELVLLAARRGGALVGLGAFFRRDGVLRFVGHGRSDYTDLLCAADDGPVRDALLRRLVGELRRGERIELRHLPGASPTRAALAALGHGVLCTDVVPCPATVADGDPRVFHAVLHKRSLRRHHGWFRRQPGWSVEHLRDAHAVLPALDAFFAQHEARWQGTRHPSLFRDERNRAFYRAVVRELAPAGWLCFTRTRVGATLTACHFGFVHDGVLTWYKPSFAIELARRSPGEALLAELFAMAAADGLREVDFTVGDEAFKRRFANRERTAVTLVLHAGRAAHLFAAAALRVRRTLARWLRRR